MLTTFGKKDDEYLETRLTTPVQIEAVTLQSTASAASALAPSSLRGLDGEARSAATGRRRRRIDDFEHPAHHIVDEIDP
jgi:hypothetical protein